MLVDVFSYIKLVVITKDAEEKKRAALMEGIRRDYAVKVNKANNYEFL